MHPFYSLKPAFHQHGLTVSPISEEGARFPISMIASGVWAGEIPLEKAHNLKEVGGDGRTMRQELDRIGYLGEKDAHHQAMPLGVCSYDQLLLTIIDKTRPTSNYILVNISTLDSSAYLGSPNIRRVFLHHAIGK